MYSRDDLIIVYTKIFLANRDVLNYIVRELRMLAHDNSLSPSNKYQEMRFYADLSQTVIRSLKRSTKNNPHMKILLPRTET